MIGTVIDAVVWSFPERQAHIRFDFEILFWIWAIPTAIHYLAIGIGRVVNRYEARQPLPGPTTDELAFRAFVQPKQGQSAMTPQDPDAP